MSVHEPPRVPDRTDRPELVWRRNDDDGTWTVHEADADVTQLKTEWITVDETSVIHWEDL